MGNFNPRSREGSDDNRSDFSVFPSISIHAPAKGATLTWIMFLYLKKYFNPRSCEGSDHIRQVFHKCDTISIHAPAKGATSVWLRTIHLVYYFNPRSREGSDDVTRLVMGLWGLFQSTLPRRERLRCPGQSAYQYRISIHAPAKGATVKRQILFSNFTDFNPRSREGSDNHQWINNSYYHKFQSTLPRRERL